MKFITKFCAWLFIFSTVWAGIPPIPEPGKIMFGRVSLPSGSNVEIKSMTWTFVDDQDKSITLSINNGIEVKKVNNFWWYIAKLPFATREVNGQTLDDVGLDQYEFKGYATLFNRSLVRINNAEAFFVSPANPSINFPSISGELAERGDVELVNFTVATINGPPTALTGPASSITTSGSLLSGSVNPSYTQTTVYFEYGLTTSYGLKSPNQTILADSSDHDILATISGLQSNSTYNFRIVSTNANGTTHGLNKTFTTLATVPPIITSGPNSQLVSLGSQVNFFAAADGLPVPTLQWYKDNVLVGSGSIFTIPNASLANSGTYTLIASNTANTASSSVKLGVINTSNSFTTVTNGSTFSATVLANGPGIEFQWSKDGNPLNDGGTISGTRTAKLVITSMKAVNEGDYTCLVSMDNLIQISGIFSANVISPPVLENVNLGPWTVGHTVSEDITAQNLPTKFTVKGLPSGVTFDAKSGHLSGKPRRSGTYKLIITASNVAGTSDSNTVYVTVDPLPENIVGNFNGLISKEPFITKNYGAGFNLTISTSGNFSGKVSFANESISFSSSLDFNTETGYSASVHIQRKRGLPSLIAAFSIDTTTGTLVGTLTDGLVSSPPSLLAHRNPWPKTSAISYAGSNYKFGLRYGGVTNTLIPGGCGYGNLKITSSGRVTVFGKLADGRSFTRATLLGSNGQIAIFSVPYTNKSGAILGWISVNLAGATFTENFIDGSLSWTKDIQPLKPNTYNYAQGIPTHDLIVNGGKYYKPKKGELLLGLPVVGIDQQNAKITFTRGGIDITSMWPHINLHECRVLNTQKILVAQPNPAFLKIAINSASGALSGSLKLSDESPYKPGSYFTRVVKFYGQIIPGQNAAWGYFLLPELPEPNMALSKSPVNSGRLEFLPLQ